MGGRSDGMMNRCARCDKRVYLAEKKLAADKVWHAFCFSCVCCRKLLNTCSVYTWNGELYCRRCYRRAQNSGRSSSSSLSEPDEPDFDSEEDECLPSCPGGLRLGYSHMTDNRSCRDYLRPCQLGKTMCYQEDCPGWCDHLPPSKPGDVIAVHVDRRCANKPAKQSQDIEKSQQRRYSPPTTDDERGSKYPISSDEGSSDKSNKRRAKPHKDKEQLDGCTSRTCFMPAPRDLSSYYSRQHSLHTCDMCFPVYETCDCTSGYSAVYFKKNICRRCGLKVFNAEKMVVGGGVYHDCCFTCYVCRKPLQMLCLEVHSGEIYCKHCYSAFFGVIGYGYGMVYTQ